MSTTVQAPAPRNLAQEAGDTLQTQINLAPQQLAAYQQTAPGYAATDLRTLGTSLFGPDFNGTLTDINNRLTSESAAQSAAANSQLRQNDLRDVQQYGGQAQQAYQDANAGLFGWRQAITDRALAGIQPSAALQQQEALVSRGFTTADPSTIRDVGSSTGAPMVNGPLGFNNVTSTQLFGPAQARDVSAMGVRPNTSYNGVNAATGDYGLFSAANRLNSTGPSNIQQTLESQAAADLALGKGLSAEDKRAAEQAAREGWAARGLINSNGAVAAEVLNKDALGRQREAERRAFAAQTDQAGFGERQQGFSNALGLSDAARGYAGLGLQAQQANLGAQLQGNQLGFAGQQANQDAFLRAQQANQARDLQMNNQFFQTGAANQDAALRAQLANQSAGLQTNQMGLNAALANQQAQLATNSLNQQAALANQQADAQRNAVALQFLNRNDAMSANQFNQLGQINQADMARQLQNNAQYQQAFQNYVGTQYDPFQGVLGRQSVNQGTNAGLFGQGAGAASGAYGNQAVQNQFNPFNGYAQDLYNTNYNGQVAANIASANGRNGLFGAGLGALGTIGGGFFGGLKK